MARWAISRSTSHPSGMAGKAPCPNVGPTESPTEGPTEGPAESRAVGRAEGRTTACDCGGASCFSPR
jgi:hypothetical protein